MTFMARGEAAVIVAVRDVAVDMVGWMRVAAFPVPQAFLVAILENNSERKDRRGNGVRIVPTPQLHDDPAARRG